MATGFRPANVVREMAQPLINAYHRHLEGVRIEYVFSSTTPKKGGKEVWGTARLITNLNAYLAGEEDDGDGNAPFFVMTISELVWVVLEPAQKQALVDHELAHMFRDDDGLKLLPHDLEEFHAVYARHGNWKDDVTVFEKLVEQRLAGQQALDFAEDPEIAAERELQRAVHSMRSAVNAAGATITARAQ